MTGGLTGRTVNRRMLDLKTEHQSSIQKLVGSQAAWCYSATVLLRSEKPSLNMDIQLMITTNTQPISPVKNRTSTTRVARTMSELAIMLATRAFLEHAKSRELYSTLSRVYRVQRIVCQLEQNHRMKALAYFSFRTACRVF